MGRQRKSNHDLPPRVYFRHGRYWHVYGGKWSALPRDKGAAIREANRIDAERGPGWTPKLQAAVEASFRARGRDAKARNIEFSITLADVLGMVRDTKWCCAVTGIPFRLVHSAGKKRKPFAPSIDRIEPSLGYVAGNVRVVCLATNFAMNEWGDSVMKELAEGWLKAEFRRRVLDRNPIVFAE